MSDDDYCHNDDDDDFGPVVDDDDDDDDEGFDHSLNDNYVGQILTKRTSENDVFLSK